MDTTWKFAILAVAVCGLLSGLMWQRIINKLYTEVDTLQSRLAALEMCASVSQDPDVKCYVLKPETRN